MGEEAPQPPSPIHGVKYEKNSPDNAETSKIAPVMYQRWYRRYNWWITLIIYSFFLLAGLTVGTLLGRVYFNNGGRSKWIETLVQVAGYPILFPIQWFTTTKTDNPQPTRTPHYHKILALIYISFGIFIAANCMLYTIGLQYLPVTTYTLICTSQLGFNALFAYFLNAQKFTPYIINSIVLLTISPTLLVFQTDPGDSNKTTKMKYTIGFICTVGASAGTGLLLSLTQLAFQRIIKRETIRAVMDMIIYQSVVATFVVLIGLFASGEWRKLGQEMDGFKTGKVSYVMNLFWTAVAWQTFSVGCVGLIFKISSLFANVISILGVPLVPVTAVVFLGDKLTGLKAMSMVLAIWGFVSYTYQHYLDDLKIKEDNSSHKGSEIPHTIERA